MNMFTRILINTLAGLAFGLLAVSGNAADGEGIFSGTETSEYPAWFKESFLNFGEDVQEAASKNKRVLLYFYQDGCPYCSKMVKDNFGRADIARTMQADLETIAINMWGDRDVVTIEGKPYAEKNFAAALRVNFTPTLVFLNEQGKVALRLNGYYPPDEFRLVLAYVAGHKEKSVDFHDYMATHTAAASGKLNAEPFFLPPPYALARSRIPADRPLAVFFEQAPCANCDILHKKILTDPATRALVKQFEAVQLDLHSDTPVITPGGVKTTAGEWARKLGIGYAPSIVFFDKHGKEVMRIDAFLKTFHFQSVFDYVLQEAYLEEPSFQRYLSARAARLIKEGIDINIFGY